MSDSNIERDIQPLTLDQLSAIECFYSYLGQHELNCREDGLEGQAEDCRQSREVIKLLLKQLGIEVLSGEEAARLLYPEDAAEDGPEKLKTLLAEQKADTAAFLLRKEVAADLLSREQAAT